MRHKLTTTSDNDRHSTQRGAALIMMLFVSLLILAGALMLMVATTTSATNAISSTDEVQAYYAAEAGLQEALNVLRGNVAPHPNDGAKINFKNAINVGTSNNPSSGVAQLSRWLVYNYPTTGTADRVTLSPSYSTVDGLAYAITGISDPDNYKGSDLLHCRRIQQQLAQRQHIKLIFRWRRLLELYAAELRRISPRTVIRRSARSPFQEQ